MVGLHFSDNFRNSKGALIMCQGIATYAVDYGPKKMEDVRNIRACPNNRGGYVFRKKGCQRRVGQDGGAWAPMDHRRRLYKEMAGQQSRRPPGVDRSQWKLSCRCAFGP